MDPEEEYERTRELFLYRLAVYFLDEIGWEARNFLDAADNTGRSPD